MANQYIDPTYLEVDYQNALEKLRELMAESEVFKDYNYEGSNITMLMELVTFLTDQSTYFSNKIVKNIYPESAEVYETMHSVAEIRGYKPKGYIAPHLDLNVKVLVDIDDERLPSPGDQLYVPAWFQIDSGLETEDGESIVYITTDEYTFDIPHDHDENEYNFILPMKQGKYYILEFTPDDIVNNKIMLPSFKFDHDLYPYDENPGITLYVNGEPWKRVNDFEKDISYLKTERNLYFFEFSKYQRYNIVFSNTANIPSGNDRILIVLIRTLGPEGDIASRMMQEFVNEKTIPIFNDDWEVEYTTTSFIRNLTSRTDLKQDHIEVINELSSFNSSNPESIDEIKENSRNLIFGQTRNITTDDYRDHLREHPEVIKGNAWGEAEINPGNTYEYNKVYLSIIPPMWEENYQEDYFIGETSFLGGEYREWYREDVDLRTSVFVPKEYSNEYKDEILLYLEPRKYIGSLNEIFVIPNLVYFAFDFGIRTRRGYNITEVAEEVKRKLDFYFDPINRTYNETIDFKEIQNFLLDTSVMDHNNKRFPLVRGINSLVMRDVLTYTPFLDNPEYIYDPNDDNNYPVYTVEDWEVDYDNVLKPIKLGYDQFPVLALDNCTFIREK